MRPEDGRLPGTGAGLHLVIQFGELAFGGLEGAVELLQFRRGILRRGCDHDLAALQLADGSDGDAGGPGHAGHGTRLPLDRGTRRCSCRLGGGLRLFLQPGFDGCAQRGQRRVRIRPLGHDADGRAAVHAEVQEGDQALGVADPIPPTDPEDRLEALRDVHQRGRRAGMQTVGAVDDDVEVIGQIFRQRRDCGGRLRLRPGRQPPGNFRGVGGAGQTRRFGGVAQHAGQVGQDFEVFIGLRRDAHHEVGMLTGIPLDAVRNLEHGDAGMADQAAILWDTMGNGDAVAEEGVGDLLAGKHALDVARLDVPGIDQHLSDLADSLVLVRRPGADADRGPVQSDHVTLSIPGSLSASLV